MVSWFREKDMITDERNILENATTAKPIDSEIEDLLFASKICKPHPNQIPLF